MLFAIVLGKIVTLQLMAQRNAEKYEKWRLLNFRFLPIVT